MNQAPPPPPACPGASCEYDELARVTKITYVDNSYTTFDYWLNTTTKKTERHYHADDTLEKTFNYYQSGNQQSESFPDGSSSDRLDENYYGDGTGRLSKTTNSNGSYTTFEEYFSGTDHAKYQKDYDSSNNIVETREYDSSGALIHTYPGEPPADVSPFLGITEGGILSGTVFIQPNPDVLQKVQKVAYYVNGTKQATQYSAPFTLGGPGGFDTTTLSEGVIYSLSASVTIYQQGTTSYTFHFTTNNTSLLTTELSPIKAQTTDADTKDVKASSEVLVTDQAIYGAEGYFEMLDNITEERKQLSHQGLTLEKAIAPVDLGN